MCQCLGGRAFECSHKVGVMKPGFADSGKRGGWHIRLEKISSWKSRNAVLGLPCTELCEMQRNRGGSGKGMNVWVEDCPLTPSSFQRSMCQCCRVAHGGGAILGANAGAFLILFVWERASRNARIT